MGQLLQRKALVYAPPTKHADSGLPRLLIPNTDNIEFVRVATPNTNNATRRTRPEANMDLRIEAPSAEP